MYRNFKVAENPPLSPFIKGGCKGDLVAKPNLKIQGLDGRNGKRNWDMRRNLREKFDLSSKAGRLFEKIAQTPIEKRRELLKSLSNLNKEAGLNYTLLALYRQQVKSGFVLADPLEPGRKKEKKFFDPDTNITFYLQWNPDRELRKNHRLLIERGVIARNVDETKLINKDGKGKACYLCRTNIEQQSPKEVLLEIDLAGEKFYLGANFAYLSNNHFTLMSAEHRPQRYRKEILRIANKFIDKTEGVFRVVFNGLAGASIKGHEHLQVTTEEFPLEGIRIKKEEDTIYESDDVKVSRPKYYLPVWIVEGKDKISNEYTANKIIESWQNLSEYHTENIIVVKAGDFYRTFILLRDKRRLVGAGKKDGMAVYEAGGKIILSYEPKEEGKEEIDERETFERASLETVKQFLREISPQEQSSSLLAETVDFE
ncbi:DUF4922 domain-containing protein [candidate division NPL-UPA2 bacterium]|nr:DUF4922 domain-containing protein [candidate division NPL-UPA2 bacterium]